MKRAPKALTPFGSLLVLISVLYTSFWLYASKGIV